MRAKFLFFFSVGFLLITNFAQGETVNDCSSVGISNEAVYDICAFDKTSPHSIVYEQEPKYKFVLNISLSTPLVPSCDQSSSKKVFATLHDKYSADVCFEIAIDSPDATELNSNNTRDGLILNYPQNKESAQEYNLIVSLLCDQDAPDGTIANFTIDSVENSTINIFTKSSSACPVHGLSKFTQFLHANRYKLFGLFLVLGFLLCFFGLQLFSIAVFIVGTILGTFASAILLFEWTGFQTPTWGLWLIFAVSIVLGCGIGFIAVKLEAFGFVTLGIVLGIVGGLVFYGAIIAPFFNGSINSLYFSLVVFAIIGGVIAYKTWKDIIIIATASVGSYLIVRSIAVVTTGFPSEESIAQGLSDWTAATYIYLGLIAILAISGGLFQWKRQNKSASKSDSEYNYSNIEKEV